MSARYAQTREVWWDRSRWLIERTITLFGARSFS